jgi:Mn-dependent DtxR family transcriptional regulator
MPDERTDPRQEEATQCVLVLQVLRGDHEQPWTRAELERELHDVDPAAITVALQRLNEQGVVHMEGDQVEASPCARHLDALAFICI